MLKKHGLFFLSLIISLFLFIGGSNLRIRRAEFLNKSIFFPYWYSVKSIKSHFNLQKKNKQLFKDRNQYYLQTIELKNKIRKLNKSDIQFNHTIIDFTVADVIGYEGDFINRTFLINKGSSDSIKIYSPVITNNGVLGKIISVAYNHSVLLPINNPQFRLGVLDANSRVQGILTNNYSGQTFMDMIPLESDISIGDTVLTSNFSTIFPKSIPVGTIKSISTTSNLLHMKSLLTLFSDVNNVEEIIILNKKGCKDGKQDYNSQ